MLFKKSAQINEINTLSYIIYFFVWQLKQLPPLLQVSIDHCFALLYFDHSLLFLIPRVQELEVIKCRDIVNVCCRSYLTCSMYHIGVNIIIHHGDAFCELQQIFTIYNTWMLS